MMKERWVAWAALALATLFLVVALLPRSTPDSVAELPYSEFRKAVEAGTVARVTLRGDEAAVELKPATAEGTPAKGRTRLPPFGDQTLLPALEAKGVELVVEPGRAEGGNWLLALVPWAVLIAIYLFIWNRMYRNVAGGLGGRDVGSFLKGSAGREDKSAQKFSFADIAGQDNAKREVAELVDFLADPERFRRVGAEPPRGILLMGPPGTGKTLLAKALAGEAGVPFFHISASEFIEMFVGVGASRVRAMFDEAKKRAPSIIFIDELDAVGRVRGAGFGGGHDEREQTLNQILAEMDGFEGHESVIVLAATNRPDVLDPALLRPGRFDRHVTLELPDKAAREAILKVHVRNKPLAADVDLSVLAAGTPGFSGADLKNLVNEGAIAAAREGAGEITMHHLDVMRDKVMMGAERSLAILPEERHRLAIHESGHTAVAHYLPHADPLYKVTIIPRGRTLGGTHLLPEEERHTLPEDYLKDRLAVMLAGRAAERALLGTVSSGADEDIRQATQLARSMVARWGMAEEIGPVDLRQSEEHPFLGREMAQPRTHSEQSAHQVDEAVRRILREAEERAGEIIERHRSRVERLVAALEEQESLDRGEIDTCLGEAHGRKGRPEPAAA